MLDLLRAMKDAGTAVLLISHDLAVVARMADRVTILYAGLVMEEGPASRLLSEPAHPYTAGLLAAVPSVDGPRVASEAPGTAGPARAGCPYAPHCPLADDRCREETPPSVELEPGHRARCWHPGVRPGPGRVPAAASPPPVAGGPVLEVRGVTKRFRSLDGRRRTAVDDVSFDLLAGEALGLVGESGSGKSTTARLVLAELDPDPDAGSVRLAGQAWSGLRERERRDRRSRIQLVDQDPLGSFDPRFTVERVVAEAIGPGHTGPRARDRVVELLADVGLDAGFLGRRPSRLSGGQRHRVAIARALAPGPEVLVCDEPVSALDVTVQAQILGLLARLRREAGVSLLFISHDLGVIRQFCDRVAVMKDGAVVEIGEVDTVFTAPRHPYTSALLAAVPRLGTGTAAPLPT
ncbi:oligopeptide/dipeptide ABC transporter ATP-binding protein [Sphaerisporangium sp. NPDC049003]|uniref:oligopeptide/dipeptide ABC transporter ATP-binding protein n=1 Tax=Sphaerisporangium sp. NPDC049003 TaxID=3364517 RepID=UPI003723728B